jgi:leader peptidase (prepilin peptidase)/N-methyltransferase
MPDLSLVPPAFGYILAGVFGAIIGSFLNVVIHRVPLEESIVFPNSRCPSCGAVIAFYDNIPVLSWMMLGAKCRGCKERISFRYPAVELLTALLFVAVAMHDGLSVALPFDLVFVSALVALIFIDAEHMILPNVITYPGMVFALSQRQLTFRRLALARARRVRGHADLGDFARGRSDRRVDWRRIALADGLDVGEITRH